MGELTGLCAVCNKPATQSCLACGALICDRHMGSLGMCLKCARGRIIGED